MSARVRLLPHPVLSLTLFALWQLIAGDGSGGHIVLAALVAIGLPLALRPHFGPAARITGWSAAVRLSGVVLADIVRSNIAVAKLALGPARRPRPGFFAVVLASDDPRVAHWVATIVTMTPGTVSCRIDPATGHLLVHALDLRDPAGAAATIKARYEQPLREMLGC